MALEVDTDGHIRALTQTLNEMRGMKEHCDFTIKVGSLEIFAHKNVLSAGSDYFKAMLSHDTKENQTGVAEIKEAEPTCVKKCIDFIYTGIPPKLDDDIKPLTYVAHLMQLTKLCGGIEKYLNENLSPETFFTAQKLANLYSLGTLAEKCDHFALKNFELISQNDAFFHFDKNYLKNLVSSKTVTVKEESKLDAILRWVKFDSEKRNEWLHKLLKYVSLPMIPTAYLRYLIENESLINKNSECLKMLSLGLMDKLSVYEVESYKDLTSKKDYIMIFDKASGYLQKFSPTDNSLVQMQKMNDDMMKSFFTAVCVDEYIYVLMQNRSVYRLLYSNEEATWEKMESFAFDHGWCPPAVSLKNYIYVIGGHWTCSTKSVEKYDTHLNKWTKLPDKPQESECSEPVVLNGHIYCCDGLLAGKYNNNVERFDPENLAWMTVAPMNENKAYVSAVEFEGKLFVLGGYDGKHFATSESYEHQHNIWKIVNHMSVPRSWFRSFEINGELYAVGGYYSSPETIEKYNSENNVWRNIEVAVGTKMKIVESVKVKF